MNENPDTEEDFVQLLVSHQSALLAFILALLPGHPEMNDVVQEVNASLWKKRSEFEMGTNFKAWMFSVAKFKVMALWRDEKRRKVWAVPEETLNLLIDEAAAVCHGTEDPRHVALRQCLLQLRPDDRSLVLRYYGGEGNMASLASELGRKAENLKGSMHRIRLSLRTCMMRKIGMGRALS